VVYRKRESS